MRSYPCSIRILCEERDMQDRYAGDVGDEEFDDLTEV